VPLTVVLADARPAALLALASYVVVLADARPAALLALASYAVVLADARPAALLALSSYVVVLADARPAELLAHVPLAVVSHKLPEHLPSEEYHTSIQVLTRSYPVTFFEPGHEQQQHTRYKHIP
jgi:hypothetical protein